MTCLQYAYLQEDSIYNYKERAKTQGSELEMVLEFLRESPPISERLSQKYETAVLIEPHFASGYPDILFVQYDSSAFLDWTEGRERLSQDDLKLFAYVLSHHPSRVETISNRIGFSLGEIEASLNLLAACGLVEQDGNVWRSEKKNSFFGIKRIISIEAKINRIRDVLHQALYNKLFSTETYILTNSKSPSDSTLEDCKKFGIGILSNSGFSLCLKASREKMPINYTTLQINEWLSSFMNKGASHGSF